MRSEGWGVILEQIHDPRYKPAAVAQNFAEFLNELHEEKTLPKQFLPIFTTNESTRAVFEPFLSLLPVKRTPARFEALCAALDEAFEDDGDAGEPVEPPDDGNGLDTDHAADGGQELEEPQHDA